MQDSNLEDFAKNFSEKILKNIILHIQKDIDFYLVIFKLDRKSQLEDKISELMYANMVKIISNKQKISGIPIDYFHSYFSGATISFIKHWVQDNNRMEPNIVADHLFKIIFNGPLRLMAKEQYK